MAWNTRVEHVAPFRVMHLLEMAQAREAAGVDVGDGHGHTRHRALWPLGVMAPQRPFRVTLQPAWEKAAHRATR